MFKSRIRYESSFFFFVQAEDGIRDLVRSRGLGDVYKRQVPEGGGGETGGGGVYVDPYKTGNNTGGGGTVTQTPTNQTSFLGMDLNNLLIPGALVVLYLMMKK